MTSKIAWPHPGKILLHEFLEPMGLAQYRLAREIGVSQRRIGGIVAGSRSITGDIGLRLADVLGRIRRFEPVVTSSHPTLSPLRQRTRNSCSCP